MFFNRYYQQQQQQQQASPNTPMDQVTFQTYPMPDTATTAPANNNLPVKVFITISRRAKHKCGVGRTPKRAPEEIRRFRTTEDVSFDQLKKQVAHVAKLQERKLEITSIKYKDEDGDFVNCDSQDEWTEAILNCSNSSAKVLILSVVASKQCPSEDEEEEEEEKQTKSQQTEEEGKEVEEDGEKEKLSPRNHHPHHPPHHPHHGPRHHHRHHPHHPRQPHPHHHHHHPFHRSFHRNIVCDGCGQQGIVGVRHKCAFCPDYDLCDSCYAKREQIHYRDHQFIPIEHPIPTFFCDASFVMVPPPQQSSTPSPSSNEENVVTTRTEEQPKEQVVVVKQEEVVADEENKKEQENLDEVIEQAIENDVVIPMESEEKKDEEEPKEEQEFVVVEPEPVLEPEPEPEPEPVKQEEQEEQHNDGPVEIEQVVEPEVVNVQPSAPSAPIVQEAPSSSIDPAHATTLDILKQMGFDNEELALFLIRKHKNNVQLVVNEYLNHQ